MKRLVVLAALLVLATPAYPFGKNKIVYDELTWNVYHSTHFDVYFYDEERDSLQRVVDAAESAYLDLSQKFNYQISKKIPLIFYATHSAFEQSNVILNFIPEGVGAFAEPARNRMVLPIDMPDDELLELITHELTHIFEYEILFQGKFGKNITANPPQWLMEGLASFMAEDEDSRDRMVLRDAVVNDRIPRVSSGGAQGYFAYRFGHSVFRYMQETYGWEGLRDFIYEYRNTLGNNIDRALKRAFNVTPDEFDSRFRTWLRKQYLPALVAKGEPQEYGDPFRVNADMRSDEISAVPSPSGDLLAAFTTYKDDIDVVLFNIPERRLLKNLTSGYTSEYEYPIVQSFTTAPVMGRDLAFAPSGDQIALFVRKERGRNLLLINPITGALEKSIPMPVEQQLSPVYSPDGKRIAFSAINGNQSDIFLYELDGGTLTNVTSDAFYDSSPVFSPDGKWLVYSSTGEQYAKLYRLNLESPAERYLLTSGDWNDIDASFTPDGKRLFFASDKQTGRNVEPSKIPEEAQDLVLPDPGAPRAATANFAAFNIYSLDLGSGDLLQYTDVIGGCFLPVVFTGTNSRERMVFSSYYKGQWRLYSTTTDKPLHTAEKTTPPTAPIRPEERSVFRSTSEFFIDEEKIEKTSGFKLFIDDVSVAAGVSSDQLFVSRSTIFMSDMLGHRRFIASLDSVNSFSNFNFLYMDMRKRMNWGGTLFDNRSFFNSFNFETGRIDRRQIYRVTGALGLLSYPLSRYHRFDAGAGAVSRTFFFPDFQDLDGDGDVEFDEVIYEERQDLTPIVTTTFSGDSAVWKFFGPVSGRRYQFGISYQPDIEEGGALTTDLSIDWREYKQLSSRTLLAARVYGAFSEGNTPNFYYFGGLNTLRGYDFRTLLGQYAAFANFEFRFPLVDVLATPVFTVQQMRGVFFFDVGAAHFKDEPFTFMENGRLVNGKASVGWGISFQFLGLPLNWDFAKRFDGKDTEGGFRTSFWIGETF